MLCSEKVQGKHKQVWLLKQTQRKHNICQAKEVKGQERCDQSKQQIKLIYGTFSECTQLYKTV